MIPDEFIIEDRVSRSRGIPSQLLKSIFPPLGVGRTNLTGNAVLNGIVSSGFIPAPGGAEMCTTDFLSAGLYQIDYVFSVPNGAADQYELEMLDRGGVIRLSIILLLTLAANASSNQGRINIPVPEGHRLRINRTISSNTNQRVTLAWTFMSPYLSNSPLSIAPHSVQRSESGALGPTSGPIVTGATGSYVPVSPAISEVGGDSGTGPSGESSGDF